MPEGGCHWDGCPWRFPAWGSAQKPRPCGGVSQTLGGAGIPAHNVTWELADVRDSGDAVCLAAGQWAGAGVALSSWTVACQEPAGPSFATSHRSSAPFSRLQGSLPILAGPDANLRALSPRPGPSSRSEGRRDECISSCGRSALLCFRSPSQAFQGSGLPDLPNENAGSPVKFEFQINVQY